MLVFCVDFVTVTVITTTMAKRLKTSKERSLRVGLPASGAAVVRLSKVSLPESFVNLGKEKMR